MLHGTKLLRRRDFVQCSYALAFQGVWIRDCRDFQIVLLRILCVNLAAVARTDQHGCVFHFADKLESIRGA
jgi:hypothetical protein